MKFNPTKAYWQIVTVFGGVEANLSKLYKTRESMLKAAKKIYNHQNNDCDSLFYIYFDPENGPDIGHFSGNDLE